MKKCTNCNQIKNLDDFFLRNSKTKKRNSWCKVCSQSHKKIWYETRKEKYRNLAILWSRKHREQIRFFLFNYLKNHPCVDCKNNDIRTLEFDHKDGTQKNIILLECLLCQLKQ